MKRREFLGLGMGASVLALAPGIALAADWAPSRLTVQVGFNPGGSADMIGRLVASAIEADAGWKVVVDNKGGGGGVVMATGLSIAPPDGSVIGLGVSSAMVYALAGGSGLPFDIDSFDYIGTVAVAPISILAKPDAPFNDIAGLVEYAKANGGATVGVQEKGAELIVRAIGKATGADLRPVPTKGGAEVMQQLIGGHIQAGFDGGRHADYLRSGDLKMLASGTSGRHSYAPEIATLREQGFDYDLEPYFVFMAPKGLPDDVKSALEKALDKAVASADVAEAVDRTFGIETKNLGPEGTAKMMASSLALAKALSAQ